MNPLENCLLLLTLPAALALAGYWLAARLTSAVAAERIAVAVLAGLCVLLWNVASVGFYRPLAGGWAWLCLWPIALTVADRRTRSAVLADIRALLRHRRGGLALALGGVFIVFLLWPLLSRPSLVYYDGTSNHDAFFWISSAEHLKRHTYMELPVTSATRPFTNTTPVIIGWHPGWGRMGAEGLLALSSSIVGLAPLKLYLAAAASLFVAWLAAVYLAARTFLIGRLRLVTMVALVLLQPVFVFFHGNANLPNLVGALTAAAVVIALERALRPEPPRWPWLVLVALGIHGLLCSYPEMLPFVALPAGLLWLRRWWAAGPRAAWRPAGLALLAVAAGGLLNPASSIRGVQGFILSFDTARANLAWANLFEPLSAAEYVPALATLAVVGCKNLGTILGTAASVALLVGAVLAIRRARDRVGTLVTLTGAAALLAYTLATGFNYGWQKTVQFGGAFWVAVAPVAIVQAYAVAAPAGRRLRLLARTALAGVLLLFAHATLTNFLDGQRWSRGKVLTHDWFTLRDYARDHLRDQPVLVDGASFRMAFFHGMWATYFLRDSDVYYAARGHENGGYLRDTVKHEGRDPVPPVAAYLVGRDWADAFDGDSRHLLDGDTFALLQNANRVTGWEGMDPENGLPLNAGPRITFDVIPHSPATFQLTVVPRRRQNTARATWRITRRVDGLPPFAAQVAGPPPWRIEAPLAPGKLNSIEIVADPLPAPDPLPPFSVKAIRIVGRK